jgi:(methylthio)acryloyl-CoA hydratase
MENGPTVTFELVGPIALLGLNRPTKCNALDAKMCTDLLIAVIRAEREARVGIIFGHGEHFSAGLDLKWMRDELRLKENVPSHNGERQNGKFLGPQPALNHISSSRIPFIAAIHGAAIGVGLELAAATHIRIADSTAYFQLPEGRHGVFLEGGGTMRISRLIGVSRMQDMMLTSRRYSAEEALQINLVQYAVSKSEALDKAKALAQSITRNASRVTEAILHALPKIADLPPDAALYWERVVAKNAISEDAVSRLNEFLEKPSERRVP